MGNIQFPDNIDTAERSKFVADGLAWYSGQAVNILICGRPYNALIQGIAFESLDPHFTSYYDTLSFTTPPIAVAALGTVLQCKLPDSQFNVSGPADLGVFYGEAAISIGSVDGTQLFQLVAYAAAGAGVDQFAFDLTGPFSHQNLVGTDLTFDNANGIVASTAGGVFVVTVIYSFGTNF